MLTTLLLTLAFTCKDVRATWSGLKTEPETWKCLPPQTSCSSATEPLRCCAGHCCSDGKCKPCGPPELTASSGQTAVLRGELFTDFSGRQFQFPGSFGEVYSLITEADHQLNALLQPDGEQSRELGITLRGVGIHGADTSIHVSTGELGRLQVVINDRPFRGSEMRLDGVTVTAGCAFPACKGSDEEATGITIRDNFMVLWIWNEVHTGRPNEINFRATVISEPLSQVHGILGQTLENHGSFVAAAPKTRVALPSNRQFYGEGQTSDYSTTDLFSSDSTFSMFTRKMDRRRHRRKRSMMEGNALASLALASREASKSLQQSRPYRSL